MRPNYFAIILCTLKILVDTFCFVFQRMTAQNGKDAFDFAKEFGKGDNANLLEVRFAARLLQPRTYDIKCIHSIMMTCL